MSPHQCTCCAAPLAADSGPFDNGDAVAVCEQCEERAEELLDGPFWTSERDMGGA